MLMNKVPAMLKQKTINSEITKIHPISDLIQISKEFPYLKVHSIELNSSPHGMEITTIISFENPMILSLDIHDLEFGI